MERVAAAVKAPAARVSYKEAMLEAALDRKAERKMERIRSSVLGNIEGTRDAEIQHLVVHTS